MTYVAAEIASQPGCWARAAALAAEVGERLPRRGERVAVLGCGTSLHIASAYAARREAAGHGETDAFPASEAPLARAYDRIVALSRSGTTTEVLDALAAVPAGVPTVAVTADGATPIADAAGAVIELGFADESSIVQTRFATTALVLLRAHLGEAIDAVVADGERAVDARLPDVTRRRQFTFLGRGWTVGLAAEAALKLREAAGAWAEAYPAMEYRHGPISVTDSGSLVWMLGVSPDGLADEVRRAGAEVVQSTLDPLADLVRAQRVAVALAQARGLDPDHPRNLSRSVVLAPRAAR